MATERPSAPSGAPGPWWQKLLWFVVIWCASLAALSAVAYGIRSMIL